MRAPRLDAETERLQALHQYRILDTPPEQAFDDFALLAAYLCNTSVSLVSFIDEDRQWFKAKVGTEVLETSRDLALCAHTILQHEVLIIPDTTQDIRFADHPFVTGAPNIRFYAGAPLLTPAGHVIGTLCVLDTHPHDLMPAQVDALKALSRQVVAQLELRRTLQKLQEQEGLRRLLEAAVEQSSDAITITTADLTPPGPHILFVNPAFTHLTGYSSAEAIGATPRILQGPQTDRAVLDRLRVQMTQGLPFAGEIINYRKDGSAFWMEWEVAPLRTSEGVVTHFVATQRDVSTRRETQERLRQQFERLSAVHAIDASILTHHDLSFTLGLLLDQIVLLLDIHAAEVLLLNPLTQYLYRVVGRGFETDCFPPLPIEVGQGVAGRAVVERRMITLTDIEGKEAFAQSEWQEASGFTEHYAIPLITNAEVQGVLNLCQREALHQDQGWWEFLQMLCAQAALAIDHSQLMTELEAANAELVRSYDATIEGWSRALDLRDKETEGHSQRVTEMTLLLSEHLGIAEEERRDIRRGALLHDIGKMGMPDTILLKPGPLSEEEWVIMRQHPQYAYELLHPIPFLRPSLAIPYCHHERWDGNGYPNELRGEQIPLCARIFAIVDVWDALLSDRPYRAGWPAEKVREHIRSSSGTHFDPVVVEAFLSLTL